MKGYVIRLEGVQQRSDSLSYFALDRYIKAKWLSVHTAIACGEQNFPYAYLV